jgi:hypothetical protein
MGIRFKLPKAFLGLSVITIGTVGVVLYPSIQEAMVARRNAEQSEKGPQHQKGVHDSGIAWGFLPPDRPTPPAAQRWPGACAVEWKDPH